MQNYWHTAERKLNEAQANPNGPFMRIVKSTFDGDLGKKVYRQSSALLTGIYEVARGLELSDIDADQNHELVKSLQQFVKALGEGFSDAV